MRKYFITLCLSMSALVVALAQPVNDECVNAIVLPDVTAFCSPAAAYTNVAATSSNLSAANCFGIVGKDVWFAFTAVATDVTITIRGATAGSSGGTLNDPQAALYLGPCNAVAELECSSSTGSDNITEMYHSGLFIGSVYLIRVQGFSNRVGTFQICIDNYNPPAIPTSDCPTAAILCDKSSFVTQNVVGAGSNNLEMEDAQCFDNGVPGINEMNSTWFVWVCSQSGTLEFTLTPLNAPDDLDFVLYRLPNGIGNCSGKQIVRCMASGLSQNQTFPSPCLGPTGLRAGDPDTSEDAGCSESGDDAWLQPFNMIAGETYALVVNNFSETGNGFRVEFGGTGQFLGPEAKFTTVPSAVCLGTPIQVVDASTFSLGAITAWAWSFGADAVPQTATGPGPHNVQFNQPGDRIVTLTLQTELGCKVTDQQLVKVFPDVEVDTIIAAPDCNGTANGEVTIANIKMGTPPYMYSWNGGPFTDKNTLSGLGVGVYTLKIRDSNNCETDLSIPVAERILTAVADVIKPLCFGDDNGKITLNVTNGKPQVLFDWGNGFVSDNSLSGLAAGIYTIKSIDGVLCKGTFNVTITDNPPLEITMDTVNISCFGANDGMATANVSGGVGNYTYLWSDGQTTQKAVNLAPGQYSVTVSDGNECTILGAVFITQPPDVGIDLLGVVNLLCSGIPTGEIDVAGNGGRPPYEYSAVGSVYQPASPITGLYAGDYWVKVKDSAGCQDSVLATITQPPPVEVVALPMDTTLNLGFTVNVTTVTSPFNRPVTFEWTPATGLSCTTCAEPVITAIDNQLYLVKVTDQDGCMGTDTVRIIVKKDRPIYVPNVFAPDKAYPNDHFTLFGGPGAKSILILRIYDRWGSLVYETRDIELNEPNLGWDGTYKGDKMFGVFTFYATVSFVDDVEVTYEGSVTVYR